MTASPASIAATVRGFAEPLGEPANDRRTAPPRRVLPPQQRQEIAAMATAYLRELGVGGPDRLMSFVARLIERPPGIAATAGMATVPAARIGE